jgi:carboxymethylenebutenolidase
MFTMRIQVSSSGVDGRHLLADSAAFAGVTATADLFNPPTRVLDQPGPGRRRVTIRNTGGEIAGYMARPASAVTAPGVLVIADDAGEEYVANTCVALAMAGFVGLAPDLGHRLAAGASDATPGALPIVQSAAAHLISSIGVRQDRLSLVGFGRGGRLALLFGAAERRVKSVVAFHPPPMNGAEIATLKAAIQIHHGTGDDFVRHTSSVDTETLLRRQRTPVELFLYPGCTHGFFAYTQPSYDGRAAALAWRRATTFLSRVA